MDRDPVAEHYALIQPDESARERVAETDGAPVTSAVTGRRPFARVSGRTYRRSMRAILAALLAMLVLAGCTPRPPVPTGSSPAAAGGACRSDYTTATLPPWAQSGFTPPTQPMPYVLGDRGDIVAILWADHEPLQSPPAATRNNKILWVSRVGGGDLTIDATLESSGRHVTRSVPGGPGPSIIDLPAPGCWSLDLTWGTAHDHMLLEYVAP